MASEVIKTLDGHPYYGTIGVAVCTLDCGPRSISSTLIWYLYLPSKKNIPRVCEFCGSDFLARITEIRRGKARFCSRSCAARSKPPVLAGATGPANPNWRGGVICSSAGYHYVRMHEHPRATNNGYVKRADLVMEEVLGRELLPDEIVHHKNEDKGDDSPENLEVITYSAHSSLHGKARGKKPVEQKSDHPTNRRYEWPADEILLQWRRNASLREIAAEMGCSHKSVDRRIKKIQKRGKRQLW